MTTWLCRLMAAVFTLNILAPTDLLAQTRRAPATRVNRMPQPAAVPSNEDIRASVEEKFKDSVSAAQTKYEEAKGAYELFEAIQNLHAVMGTRKRERDRRQSSAEEARQQQARQREQDRSQYVAPADNTRVAPRNLPLSEAARPTPDFEALAERINSGEITVPDLLTYLDPLEDDNQMYTVFAAEVFGNSVDSMTGSEEDTAPETLDFLLEVQLRAIYRLQNLSKTREGASAYIMAAGSLRSLLLKVNNFFNRVNMPNPLFEKGSSSAGSGAGKKASQPTRLVRVNGPDGSFSLRTVSSGKGTGSSKTQKAKVVFSEAMYQRMMNDILAEIRAYKEKNLNENKEEYTLLLLALQYAVGYAMEFDPSQVATMVGYFDKGPSKTDFKQQYSSALNTILTTVFENVKFTPHSSEHADALRMFYDFSDPKKYSLPTRVFALEMASLLYRPHDNNDLLAKNTMNMSGGNGLLGNMFVINMVPPEERYRATFAMRAVDIYAPLNKTHYLAMKDYGLDSEQMKMLADKMAYIYNGFANDELKFDRSRKRAQSYVLDKAEDGTSLILNKGNSVPRLNPSERGQQFQLPDGSLTTIGGFGYSSAGYWVEMNLRNGINTKKRSDEYSKAFTMFIGEAILWVFGGEILGIAWRVTRGAVVALPQAVRAATLANKGRRMLSFGVEIRKGVRFSNLAQTLRQNGITVAATRTEKVRHTVQTGSSASGGTASSLTQVAPPPVTAAPPPPANMRLLGMGKPSASAASSSQPNFLKRMWNRIRAPRAKKYTVTEEAVSSPVTSMRDFRNSRGFWRGQQAPVEEWSVLIQQPNFSFQSAVLSGPKATRLQNGIRNWDDWRYLMHNARTAQGARLSFNTPLKPWNSLWQSTWKPMFGMSTPAGAVQQEQRVMGATARVFAKDAEKGVGEGVFDYWKYTDNGWVRINQKDFMALGDGMGDLPDYYSLLGVSRSASDAEIKNAAKKMLARWHPDRAAFHLKEGEDLKALQKIYDKTFKEIADARNVLTDKAARAAYDAKLDASQKAAKMMLAESPEGASLAITSNVGQTVPEGFSPLAGGRGLGFNTSNWGNVDNQLAQHLSSTDQTMVLGKSLLMADPFIGGTAGNLAFFGGWSVLDEAVNPAMQNWIAGTSTEEIEKMQKMYGDAYDPELLAKDQEESAQNLRELAEQGYNTASPSLYDDVTGAERPSSVGAFFSFPLLAGWHGLSKIELANNLGLNSPFNSKQARTMLEIGAQRIQLQRMAGEYQKVKTRQQFDAFYSASLENLEQAKAAYTDLFAQLSAEGLDLRAERKEVMAHFESIRKAAAKIAGSSADEGTKAEQISSLFESVADRQEALDNKINARVEYLRLENLIAEYEAARSNYRAALHTEGYEDADPSCVEKMNAIYQNMINKLRQLQKKKISFEAKQQELRDAENEFILQSTEFEQSLGGLRVQQTDLSPEELYEVELRGIAGVEAFAKEQGLEAGEIFKAWRQRVDALYKDPTYSADILEKMFELTRASYLQQLEDMSVAKDAPKAPAGTVQDSDLEELLPDVTSSVSTGV